MDYKEYLLNQSAINLQYIAEKMWPTNSDAKAYLSRKLNEGGRPWTESDNEKAKKALNELGQKLITDTTDAEIKTKQPIETKRLMPVTHPPPVTQSKKEDSKRIVNLKALLEDVSKEDKSGAVKTNNKKS